MTTPGEQLQAYLATRRQVLVAHTEVLVALAEHRVLLTAPHGKLHVRDGARKHSDDNTTILAIEAARASGARSIVLAAPAGEDANWDSGSRFRGMVLGLLRMQPGVLIDVHGMRDAHGPDVIAGTAGGRRRSAEERACDWDWSGTAMAGATSTRRTSWRPMTSSSSAS